jgi:N-acetylneuraminate synthase
MKRIKISSSNITNLPLIEYCAKTKLPLYISTGGATLAEVSEAVEMALLYNQQITILHCNLEYPVELNNVNMGVLDTFRYAFPNIKIGFSDHTKEIYEASEQAILLGATCIEKHITFDKEAEGPDHFFAITPEELKILVDKAVNAVKLKDSKQFNINQEIYGSSSVVCNDNEKPVREFGYSTLFVNKDIKKGDVITEQDILILRKAKKDRGLEPKYISLFIDNQVVAKSDISFEDSIKWEHIL